MMIKPRPNWLNPATARWAWWVWEPDYAYRRQGRLMGAVDASALWLDDWYDRLHSEETVKTMADIGITVAVTHFYKGFGLNCEKAGFDQTQRLVDLCHRYGIRVLGYTQFGSIYYETFLKEVPEAKDWGLKRSDGSARDYGVYYRWVPDWLNPDFIAYLKRAMTVGLLNVGLDGLHFDNTHGEPGYSDTTLDKFKKHLSETVSDPYHRFGIADFDNIRIPPESMLKNDIRDPLTQEWIRFRVAALADVLRDLRDHALSVKPDAVLLFNPSQPRGMFNTNAERATYMNAYGRAADMIWAENGNFPRVENGILIHQLESYKIADAVGYACMSTTWLRGIEGIGLPTDAAQIELSIAESAAFGALPGLNWALRPTNRGQNVVIDDPALRSAAQTMLAFISSNADVYADSRSAAQVAVLYSFPSITFNHRLSYGAFCATLQSLAQRHVPFNIIFADTLERVRQYDVVILPETVCLSDTETSALMDYVQNGGSLVLIGDCGDADENFRQRRVPSFSGINHPRIRRIESLGQLPEPDGYTLKTPLPARAPHLTTAIRELLGDRTLFDIDAPETALVEIRRSSTGAFYIHIVNYGADEIPAIRIVLNGTFKRMQATVIASPADPNMDTHVNGNEIVIFKLKRYGIIRLDGNLNVRKKNAG
ncbi:MAG: beta-galactosidase trimerization domain-containing protein [Planctomycetota bacterium]